MSNPPNPPQPASWEVGPDATAGREGRLFEPEVFWRDHQTWLRERGYILRPRYHQDWVASWLGTEKEWGECEDGEFFLVCAPPILTVSTVETVVSIV